MLHISGLVTAWFGARSPRFVFREPSLSSVSNIYALPFDADVWGTYLATVLALAAILHAAARLDARLRKRGRRQVRQGQGARAADWSETLLNCLGLACQQGWPDTPDNITSRIIFLFFCILSIFFFTAYSAIIVSLLQSPSSAINSLDDLAGGPLKVAFHDTIYNRNSGNYVNLSAVPVVRRLFEGDSRHGAGSFLEQQRGLELVRRGQVAFHVDYSAYKIISDTWQEHEKCNLKELRLYPQFAFIMPVQKGSPYREIIKRKLRWLREVGLVRREWLRWVAERPRCASSGAVFVSVGVQEFRPALEVLAHGAALSAAVLAAELLARRQGRCRAR
ncbi:uncharacterized protein LOC134539650 [Bacillus rossius redtenbacheri]|uniref:uncharacterized protein LOC134539650 n=1 Tax=Bacillus rossius redtenbacheri TaxID=93214 RepID=UPI002FDE3A98